MVTASRESAWDRAGSAAGAIVVQLGLLGLFFWGLGADVRRAIEEPMQAFDALAVPPPPDPPASPPPQVESDSAARLLSPRAAGGSSPPNLRAEPTPVVAPPPRIPLPVEPPITAAPIAGEGAAPSAGAADIRGPGYGSGGTGDGSGRGAGGGGGGGGFGRDTPPRRIRGSLRNADYPEAIGVAGVGGTVEVIFRVLADGSVTDCRIVESSGSRALDDTTCNLIERRYVYEPSRDESGRPVASRVVETHSWFVEDLPREPRPRRRRTGW